MSTLLHNRTQNLGSFYYAKHKQFKQWGKQFNIGYIQPIIGLTT